MATTVVAPHAWGTAPEFVGPRHELRERLLLQALLRARPGSEVLNVGAGQGSFSRLLDASGFDVVSSDMSDAAVEVLRGRVKGRVTKADACRLPFEDASFDVVVLAEVLEHIEDDGRALAEAARVLRPGGVLAGSVPGNAERFGPSDTWAGHVRRYGKAELVERCENAGFAIRNCRAWGFPVSAAYHFGLYEPRLVRRGATSEVRGKSLAMAALRLALQVDRLFVGVERGSLGFLFVAEKKPAVLDAAPQLTQSSRATSKH